MALSLVELDSIEITVLIDNELDPISASPTPAVKQSGGLRDIALRRRLHEPSDGSEGSREIRMEDICCSAHGLSLMITGVVGSERRTMLFDTGPEGRAWELNVGRLGVSLHGVEAIHLSHWHRDHSGGMVRALEMITDARGKGVAPVVVDLHPDRPDLRGTRPPGMDTVSLGADPTFEEVEEAGGEVVKIDQPHTVLGGMFATSGEIPRVTEYEQGLRFGVRLREGKWVEDTLLKDERILMCKLKNKGLVIFTGCSHAGVVNASRHGRHLGDNLPLYAVMGGLHLADADADHITKTVADLKALDVQVLLTGHCTGWKAKFEIQNQMPGRLVPSFVGSRYVL